MEKDHKLEEQLLNDLSRHILHEFYKLEQFVVSSKKELLEMAITKVLVDKEFNGIEDLDYNYMVNKLS